MTDVNVCRNYWMNNYGTGISP